MAVSLFQGASIGPLIDLAIQIDPSLIFSVFVGTSLAFACFSRVALVARSREYLYLGGLVSSRLSILLCYSNILVLNEKRLAMETPLL
ncbi:Bax inhibitor 1 [Spatholobus suberectus]|nr:Bax inhibitor 1 [Spatholobus suberectus]